MAKKKESRPIYQIPTISAPYNVTAEQYALGAILLYGNEILHSVATKLSPEDFYFEPHQRIYMLLLEMDAEGKEINTENAILYFQYRLKGEGYTEIGGHEYLIKLTEMAPPQDTATFAADQIKELSYRRTFIASAIQAAVAASREDGDFPGALERFLKVINQQPTQVSAMTMEELIQMPIDFHYVIDQLIPKQSIALLVAPAGGGKTTLLVAISLFLSSKEPTPVFGEFVSQPATVLFLDGETNAPTFRLIASRFVPTEQLAQHSLFYYEWNHDITTIQGQNILKQLIHKHNPEVIIIDSLVRFHSKDENNASDMKLVGNTIKSFCTELGCSFIISHHTRKSAPFSTPSDAVRGSTEIRAFPDTVLILKRIKGTNNVFIDVDKCRHSHTLHGKRIRLDLTQEPYWKFTFAGFTDIEDTELEAAMKNIKQILEEVGSIARKELIERLKTQGISLRTVNRAISALKASETITSVKQGKFAVLRLKDTPEKTSEQDTFPL